MSTHNLCFRAKIRRLCYIPCKPQFYYIKVGCKGFNLHGHVSMKPLDVFSCYFYTPRKLCLWEGILFSRPSVRPSVTFCFLNNLKSHGWNLIKPCIHIHIYRANTYNKKIRARGHFYESYFPL